MKIYRVAKCTCPCVERGCLAVDLSGYEDAFTLELQTLCVSPECDEAIFGIYQRSSVEVVWDDGAD